MEELKKSSLELNDRKKLSITGVIEVVSFEEDKIFLTTTLGNLNIKGNDMKMNKLDVQNGDVIIVGTIISINYTDKDIAKNKENILKKLFQLVKYMPLNLEVQFKIIFYAIVSGFLFGILFDFYRIIWGIKIPNIIIAIEDILFFILCGIVIFVFLLYSGYAYFSVYVYVFIMLALIIYLRFISKVSYRFIKKAVFIVITVFRVAVKNIFYPFRLFLAKISIKK